MKSKERRQAIANLLLADRKAITGAELSKIFGVSRQIIVQDISVLKSLGYIIQPTHYGYIAYGSPLVERVFAVHHTTEETEDELMTVVENDGIVVDVFVMHKIYGKISAPLNVYKKEHVADFMAGVKAGESTELMNITGGNHYHTVRAETEDELNKIEAELRAKGYLNEKDTDN